MQLITWEDVAVVAFSFTGIVAVLGWIAKKLFEQFLAARLDLHRKGLTQETEELKARLQQANALEIEKLRSMHAAQTEAHKATLQREGAIELERLRSNMRREHFEHEIRLSELQKRRADAIVDIYARVSRVHLSLMSALSPVDRIGEPLRPERFARALGDARDFVSSFGAARVLLPERCCDVLDRLQTTLLGALASGQGVNGDWPKGLSDQEEMIRRQMDKAWVQVEKVVPMIRTELEDVMRALLGDAAPTAASDGAGNVQASSTGAE